jgi:hypothetical protein
MAKRKNLNPDMAFYWRKIRRLQSELRLARLRLRSKRMTDCEKRRETITQRVRYALKQYDIFVRKRMRLLKRKEKLFMEKRK